MVIVELAGGLGNQLFQYAYGRSISLKHSSPLYLDLRFLENKDQPDGFTYRDYALSNFNLESEVLKSQDYNIAENLKRSWKSKTFRKLAPALSSYIKEDTSKYHPSYLEASGDVYLQGYWQNPRYFNHIKSELHKELSFPQLKSQDALDLENIILSTENAVAVHVRRGDYANIPYNLATCTPEYYAKAFKNVENKVVNAKYFVFSDDPSWVQANMPFPSNSVVVDHCATAKDYEDMYLMTCCKHHIIANSSFSWWGAWLGYSEEKVVIAPKIWDGRRRSEDIVESNWNLL